MSSGMFHHVAMTKLAAICYRRTAAGVCGSQPVLINQLLICMRNQIRINSIGRRYLVGGVRRLAGGGACWISGGGVCGRAGGAKRRSGGACRWTLVLHGFKRCRAIGGGGRTNHGRGSSVAEGFVEVIS